MKEQIEKEDLVKGEWYKLNCYSNQNYLFKFDYLIGDKIYVIISMNIDWNTISSTAYLHEVGNTTHIIKATKKEVLKYFPDEKF